MSSNRIEITEEFQLPVPRNNQVLIEEESGERRKGSIVIPNVGDKVAAVGRVLAVGLGVADIPVGSWVLCNRYAGVELDYVNRKLRVVNERDVTCFLSKVTLDSFPDFVTTPLRRESVGAEHYEPE